MPQPGGGNAVWAWAPSSRFIDHDRGSALTVGVEPLDDSARLHYSANPLTSEEHTALADFLAQ